MIYEETYSASNTGAANPKLIKELKRHVCSLTVLAYRYQRHLPHLLSPGLSNLADNYLRFGQQLTGDIATLTRRICQLNGTPVSRVEEIESSSYIPVRIGGRFELNDELKSQQKAEKLLGKVLGHTIRVAEKNGDGAISEVARAVLAKSEEREAFLSRVLR